ncbi:Sensory/regulatory protein RpfC [Lachnellula suecica]|uniref:histidine kinase n=1 Tax=Lachnellula suecica TaxID=602035 RepID=A0A8T9C6A6_9HELO|nr:Sensory/regulatory protein RpfC [Lachnellula suecica]
MSAEYPDLSSIRSMLRTAATYPPQSARKHFGMHEIPSDPDAFEARTYGPRQFRPLRQRARKFAGDTKTQSPRRAGEEEMEEVADEPPVDTLIDRTTLCLPNFAQDSIVHGGDEGFKDVLRQYFPTSESNATERLVDLKARLRKASTHDFWAILMEDMCDITGSQCGFVAKRMLVDDQDSAVEMPPLGEPGSCLMAVAFYLNNGVGVKKLFRDYRYHAYGTPCEHMKHDKVFIIPERMNEFVPNNPNEATLPWSQSEAFIGVPLFSEGKCFAHFGMMWSSEGAGMRKMGWSFIEMFLHSLEDMIHQRILEGRGFTKEVAPPESTSSKIIPLSAITASQSLKPYARSLSHELRTPMQGVVGMLDIMYSTVLDSIANQQSELVREIFKDLKSHIETVQDSSRRAVEAADNVVHAYDLDMQMPETPLTPVASDAPNNSFNSGASSRKQSPLQDTGAEAASSSPKRQQPHEGDLAPRKRHKRGFTVTETDIQRKYYPEDVLVSCDVCMTVENKIVAASSSDSCQPPIHNRKGSPVITQSMLSPNHRRVGTRQFMQTLVNEALRSGHPTSEVHTETELGETIEVTSLGSRGERQDRKVCLNIEPDVPEMIIMEEHHLQFALQKIVDNAIKFTDNGSITITVGLAQNLQLVEIRVVDTGCGITEEAKLNLFKPHFQEDSSISRSRDGLGLGLFNAKAHVRKNLGGDVTLERSDTYGPSKGSEFLIRLPISSLDDDSIVAPLVGTPPTIQHSLLPSPGMDTKAASDPVPSRSRTVSPALVSRPTPPRASPRRSTFNPALALDCPLNILIAEDNAINRNVAAASLSKLGYSPANVTVAFDGVEAVETFRRSLHKPVEEQFDAILMDIWMPNMDGYQATKEILALSSSAVKSAKIIAVTADITGDCLQRAEKAGMQGFLAKPYKVLDIEHLILQHFQGP